MVLTRTSGRASAMPETERLAAFAQTRATLAIHLSIHVIEQVVEELLPAYGADCPAAVVWRASWPDERVHQGDARHDCRHGARREAGTHGADPGRPDARGDRIFATARSTRPITTGASGPMRAGTADETQAFRRPDGTACGRRAGRRGRTPRSRGRSRRRAALWPPCATRAAPPRRRAAGRSLFAISSTSSAVLAPRALPPPRMRPAPASAKRSASQARSTAPERECRSSRPCPSFVILAMPPAMVTFGTGLRRRYFSMPPAKSPMSIRACSGRSCRACTAFSEVEPVAPGHMVEARRRGRHRCRGRCCGSRPRRNRERPRPWCRGSTGRRGCRAAD